MNDYKIDICNIFDILNTLHNSYKVYTIYSIHDYELYRYCKLATVRTILYITFIRSNKTNNSSKYFNDLKRYLIPQINNIIYIDLTTCKKIHHDFFYMLKTIYDRDMLRKDIKNIKNIIYILYLVHFFDYCKLYNLSLNLQISDKNAYNQEILNNFMISILNRYTTIRHCWFGAVYKAIIYKYNK